MASRRLNHYKNRVIIPFLVLPLCCTAFVSLKNAVPPLGIGTKGHKMVETCLWASSVSCQEKLDFRAPKLSDVDPIADLLVECFETDLKWFEWPEREIRRKRYQDMLQKFFLRRIEQADSNSSNSENNKNLFMLLAESSNNKNGKDEDKKMVGFVQIGPLPPPPGFSATTAEEDSTQQQEDKPQDEEGPELLPNDVPYIANLCVRSSHRKSGIGKKMVDICLLWLDKQQQSSVFIAVDSDNVVAKNFYERLGFVGIDPGKKLSKDYYYKTISE